MRDNLEVLHNKLQSLLYDFYKILNNTCEGLSVSVLNNDTALPNMGHNLFSIVDLQIKYKDVYTVTIKNLDIVPYEKVTNNSALRQYSLTSDLLEESTGGIMIPYKDSSDFICEIDAKVLANEIHRMHNSLILQHKYLKGVNNVKEKEEPVRFTVRFP